MLGCVYTICSYGQISISCTISSWSLWPPSHIYSYTLSVQISCIYWLCDWWFRLDHHITYIRCFIMSYLFLLWNDWFLLYCFVLLSGEIQFLSWGFVFLTKSMFSCVSCHLLVTENVHRVAFFHFFLFIVVLKSSCSVMFLVAEISLPPHFRMQSSICCIDAITLSSIMASTFSSFLDAYNISTSFLVCVIHGQ